MQQSHGPHSRNTARTVGRRAAVRGRTAVVGCETAGFAPHKCRATERLSDEFIPCSPSVLERPPLCIARRAAQTEDKKKHAPKGAWLPCNGSMRKETDTARLRVGGEHHLPSQSDNTVGAFQPRWLPVSAQHAYPEPDYLLQREHQEHAFYLYPLLAHLSSSILEILRLRKNIRNAPRLSPFPPRCLPICGAHTLTLSTPPPRPPRAGQHACQ